MGSAKDILLRPISAGEANDLIRRVHYSGKVVQNSQIHIGVFYQGQLEGAMQFGPSLDKRKLIGLVEGTKWNEFTELNRMAFTDALPRNSESRALAIAFRLLRKHAPQLKWVVSFADATQCGDGTMYRAAGFVLTGIRENSDLWIGPETPPNHLPDRLRATYSAFVHRHGQVFHNMTLQGGERHSAAQKAFRQAYYEYNRGGVKSQVFFDLGCQRLPGFQLRYIYFLDPTCRARLTVPELPFSAIDEAGARMYRGERHAGA